MAIRRGRETNEIFERATRATRTLHFSGFPKVPDETRDVSVAEARLAFEERRSIKMESRSEFGRYYFIDPSVYGYARYELWTVEDREEDREEDRDEDREEEDQEDYEG